MTNGDQDMTNGEETIFWMKVANVHLKHANEAMKKAQAARDAEVAEARDYHPTQKVVKIVTA
jgi:hypothetical protein